MKGKVVTVLGPVDPDTLGVTFTHEHLLHELPLRVFRHPLPGNIPPVQGQLFSVENLGWIRQYPYCFDDNNIYTDDGVRKAVVDEMRFFKQLGGGAIVDNGSIGLRAKDQGQFLASLSKETGVNIVTGTGFYTVFAQSQSVLKMTVEEMVAKMREDILVGIDGTGVKCGVIGEIGCSWPLADFEKKSLVSSAIVQAEVGVPVIIHPGRDKTSPEEIYRVFQEAGGKLQQTVMSHLERTLLTKEELEEFAAMGSYCEFDLFGIEVSHYQHNEDVDMPSDAQRVERLYHLVQQGYGDKICISHDIHTKHRLMKYGGHGFSHILANVLPKMKKRGFTEEDIKKILCDNPQKWLTFH
ncbi:phosphotriesterase-related protein [Caerostris extrusa]|uniref:Phosphotriesterase-related protein n=1 Tax=Caerostris extrusa TaxID=172846 RepID=A0AAV4R0A8_CAEEX|nr:phosphotriesterase-related protein [Caerostris extrusa]